MALRSSETLSYWQSGAYLRVGDVDISVVQQKNTLDVDVMARPKYVKGHNRQAYNMGWCFLSRYLYVIQTILCTYPAIFYEVFVYNTKLEQMKSMPQVVEAYTRGDISKDVALQMIPVPSMFFPNCVLIASHLLSHIYCSIRQDNWTEHRYRIETSLRKAAGREGFLPELRLTSGAVPRERH